MPNVTRSRGRRPFKAHGVSRIALWPREPGPDPLLPLPQLAAQFGGTEAKEMVGLGRAPVGPSPSAPLQMTGVQKTVRSGLAVLMGHGVGKSQPQRAETSSQLELGGENSSPPEKERDLVPVKPALQEEAGRTPALPTGSCHERVALGRLSGLSSAIPLPLFREGSFKGMLMIPTKSSVGTRERRMDLIRMASPFPVWISCKVGLESKINEVSIRPLHPTFKSWAVK